MIGLVYRDSLPQGTADELDQLVQGLVGMLYREHDPTGVHTNITADSLTLNKPNLTNGVSGAIVFQDRLGNKSTINRDIDNQSGDSVLTLANGSAFKIRRADLSGVLYDLVRLGLIQLGAGTGNGIVLYGKNPSGDTSLVNVYHDWSLLSGDTNGGSGARMLIGDDTRSISPVSLRWRNTGSGFYEWMKTTGTLGPTAEEVNLGSNFDSSLAGFWDNLYVRSITLGNGAGPAAHTIGTWTDVAFSAGNFTAGGSQTWTVGSGDQGTYAYMIVGNTMWVQFFINTSTVGGTPDVELRIAVPLGLTITGRTFATTGWALDNGTPTVLRIEPGVGLTYISLFNFAGSNWSAATDTTAVRGQVAFSIA